MRIALVSEHASPLAVLGEADAGGQNVHVAALAAALADRGHRVRVYTRRDGTGLPDRVPLTRGVEVVHVPAGPPEPLPKDELPPYMPAFGRWLTAEFDARPPDVAHAHFWMSGTATLPAGRSAGIPVVQTFHALGSVKRRYQGAADTSPADRVRVEAGLARRVDLTVATCTDEVRELVALGADPERIRVVPCGVDTARFRPSPVPADRRPRRLVAVGRLVARKGYDTAIRALAELPGIDLVVVGGPPAERLGTDPEAVRLRAVAAEAGVADRVELRGGVPHDELPAVLCDGAVVVVTPWYEPFGIVPLEAMACGAPVVGTAVGGLLDTVADGVTGRLVPAADHAAVAAACRELLADPARLTAYGAAGRRRAVARYDWARVAAETERAYLGIVRHTTPIAAEAS